MICPTCGTECLAHRPPYRPPSRQRRGVNPGLENSPWPRPTHLQVGEVFDRLACAARLLEWWVHSAGDDARLARLAAHTRDFLGGGLPDVPSLASVRPSAGFSAEEGTGTP